MRQLVSLVLFLAFTNLLPLDLRGNPGPQSAGQDRIDFLKKHAVPIRSLAPDDADFSDLEPLRQAIGNRRIVTLGETTHRDGATFAAKVRIIKFLHERMGFDVLAFEGGLYDVRKVWSDIQGGADPLSAARSGLFEEWTESGETQALWRYLGEQLNSNRPLELAGFDMQFTGSASRDHLIEDLGDYLAKSGRVVETAPLSARVTYALTHLMNNLISFQEIGPQERMAILSAAEELGRVLGRMTPPPGRGTAERDFWIQLLKSSAATMELSWKIDLEALKNRTVDDAGFNLRDRQMGENFIWLAQKAYPARKIIVWAGMSHVVRFGDTFKNENNSRFGLGDWIDKAMGSEVYTLGFTAYRGRSGTAGTDMMLDLGTAAEGSLEDLLFKTGFAFAWVDFLNIPADGLWLREPLSARPIGNIPKTVDWTRVMDGIFFIREMFPCTPIGKKPPRPH